MRIASRLNSPRQGDQGRKADTAHDRGLAPLRSWAPIGVDRLLPFFTYFSFIPRFCLDFLAPQLRSGTPPAIRAGRHTFAVAVGDRTLSKPPRKYDGLLYPQAAYHHPCKNLSVRERVRATLFRGRPHWSKDEATLLYRTARQFALSVALLRFLAPKLLFGNEEPKQAGRETGVSRRAIPKRSLGTRGKRPRWRRGGPAPAPLYQVFRRNKPARTVHRPSGWRADAVVMRGRPLAPALVRRGRTAWAGPSESSRTARDTATLLGPSHPNNTSCPRLDSPSPN